MAPTDPESSTLTFLRRLLLASLAVGIAGTAGELTRSAQRLGCPALLGHAHDHSTATGRSIAIKFRAADPLNAV